MDDLRDLYKREPFNGHKLNDIRCKMYKLKQKAVSIDNVLMHFFVLGAYVCCDALYSVAYFRRARDDSSLILTESIVS